jgi:DNA-directed RNA polymerase beta subunit
MRRVIKNNEFVLQDDPPDFTLPGNSALFSAGVNAQPLISSVQGPRGFYAARFFEQALPTVNRQAPLVRNLNEETGRSWDYTLGELVGAVKAPADGVVESVTPDGITLSTAEGKVTADLYNLFPGNRYTLTHNTPIVKPGQKVAKGDLLAPSNFTDNEGRLALGVNALVGISPYKGYSMDDAAVISEGFAARMLSDHAETIGQEPEDGMKIDRNHYVSLFPKKFQREQLDKVDANGVVKPGMVLNNGDPIILQTRPRSFSSANEGVARLTKSQRFVRKDAAVVWEGEDPAEVLDVVRTRKGGIKVLVRYQSPVRAGDKLVLRNGQKGTVSKIIPDELMPRTEAGEKLDLLLNQLSLPSRVNAATFHELLLGKIAAKTGKAYTIPSFTAPDDDWISFVERELAANGIQKEERVYDPQAGKWLDEPITTGVGHLLKLHHQAAKKFRVRGQNGYSLDRQPLKGSGGGAQRMSGLEMNVLHSSGARGVQKEAVLLRGDLRSDYWQQLRANRSPAALDKPFVWDKFGALLNGSGINMKDMGHGRLRLAPMTDRLLAERGSVSVANSGIVDLHSMEPVKGGLFDPDLVRDGKWGHVDLPFPVVNPSYDETVRTLLGLTSKEYEALLEQA